jgi:hypothetical protein
MDELAVVHTSGELAPINQIDHAQAVVQAYSDWATVLMRVVEDRGLYSTISGKRFLVYEAWALIASFDGASVDTSDVSPILENGETIGYACRAKVMKDGVAIAAGASIGYMEGSAVTRGRTGRERDRAVYSAVQTWAGSKSCRMRYSTVATLAGYQATTAEEMIEGPAATTAPHQEAAPQSPSPAAPYCNEHKTEFFMRGNMRSFAHPIDKTGKWHNMEDAMKAPTKPVKALVEAKAPTTPAEDDPPHLFDEDEPLQEPDMPWEAPAKETLF